MALKRGLRVLVMLAVVAGAVGGGVAAVNLKKRALAAAPKYGMQATAVRVAVARKGDLRRTKDYLAVVEPIRVADLSARVTATVEKVLCDENQPVKAGDVLIVLDGRQGEEAVAAMRAQVEQAQAELASNRATVDAFAKTVNYREREYQRDKDLAARGVIPNAQAEESADKADEARGKLDAARQKSAAIERQVESLKRRQAELETTLGYHSIHSPFDGVVSRRMVDPGDLAVPGKSLMAVEDRSKVKLSFDVPQQDLPEVREGLETDYPVGGQSRKATLSHLFPSLNAARMLRAEVHLNGSGKDGLVPGAYVPLRVLVGNDRDVTLVPAGCVVESPDGKPHVFLVLGDRLEARPIRVLGVSGDEVAVEGVRADEEVVVSTFLGWAQLASGQKVEASR
jgi:RND family efflux transporter MFP subunit